jgi:ubiquinone/menaquinone biosynthesis C-methylase UbiE
MEPKPAHLGLQYAEQFKDSSIAEMYPNRPPYPDETIGLLLKLIADQPRAVLDVGCGTGDICRRLANEVEHVDAVDFSQAMIEKGKTLPGGDHAHLHWIYGRIEEVELHPPYALITAGESLHWMEWDIVLPLFQRLLTPQGYLALVERGNTPNPWGAELQALIQRLSTNREFRPYNIIEELEKRQLFQKQGSTYTLPVSFVQTGEEYIQSIHSRNGFSRERMGEEAAIIFDEEVRKLLAPYLQDGLLTLSVIGEITWGKPQKG